MMWFRRSRLGQFLDEGEAIVYMATRSYSLSSYVLNKISQ